MNAQMAAQPGSKGRKRGGVRRINRDLIVETARSMDPQTMTMQAVADQMGVDRKALNYHVTDRDGLLRLVATDAFESEFEEAFRTHFEAAHTKRSGDWRDAIRAWAVAVRDSMVASGALTDFFPLESENLTVLEPAELVLRSLHEAGFDIATAGRAIAVATRFAMGAGRDVLLARESGEHPQAPEVRSLIRAGGDTPGYELFRAIAELNINSPGDSEDQFRFEIDLVVAGLESRLRTHPRA